MNNYVLSTTLLLAVVSASGANLIRNGSFETPVVGAGSYELFSKGDTFTDWTVVGASGEVGLTSGSFEELGFSFPAAGGSQWLDLTGLSNSATGVAQTVATSAGLAYTLSFYVGNVYDPGGLFGTTSTVDVFVDGIQVFTATNSRGRAQTKQVWQKFTTTITATSTKTTIAFVNGDPATDNTNGLDLVSLVEQANDDPGADTEH